MAGSREQLTEWVQDRRDPVELVGHGLLDVGDPQGWELDAGHGWEA